MSEKKRNPAVEYVQESVMELKRVTWPTGNQALKLTMIVLSFCIASVIFIGLIDWIFNFGYNQLLDLAGQNKI